MSGIEVYIVVGFSFILGTILGALLYNCVRGLRAGSPALAPVKAASTFAGAFCVAATADLPVSSQESPAAPGYWGRSMRRRPRTSSRAAPAHLWLRCPGQPPTPASRASSSACRPREPPRPPPTPSPTPAPASRAPERCQSARCGSGSGHLPGFGVSAHARFAASVHALPQPVQFPVS